MPDEVGVFFLLIARQRGHMIRVHFQSDSHPTLNFHEKYYEVQSTRLYQYEEDLGEQKKFEFSQEDSDR